MAKPIRRDLLIHTVEYASSDGGNDPWGGGSSEPVTIERVRVEPKSKLVISGVGSQIESDTTLFWDAVHSTPVEFKEQEKVTFEGREMTIVGIDRYFDRTQLHHLEVRLA